MQAKIEAKMQDLIPEFFFDLLRRDDDVMRFSLDFLDAASKVLRDNQVIFFRNYTDHGINHIKRLLVDAVRIIPQDALHQLTSTDACVIVASAFLHDLALHMSETSFAEITSGRFEVGKSPLQPDGTIIENDRPWKTLWEDYILEAARWDNNQNLRIFGPNFVRPDRLEYTKLYASSRETGFDDIFGKPLVGEFIRRHHARLAYEIAHAGFPGTSAQDFTKLAQRDFELADLVGFVARSHHIQIRDAVDHVDKQYHGDLMPLNCHVAYCMAVLRIADYLQLDDVRAPTLLLRLRLPQSPLSIDEWKKHAAVRPASFTHSDPESIYFPVRQEHSYRTHLLLRELFEGLQQELDLTSSTLRQVYRSHTELMPLRLRFSRIRSNLLEPNFGKRLPYVPTRIIPTVDPKVLSLLVNPLYEKRPECGVRELIQNAIDAVLERQQHEITKGNCIPAEMYPDFASDVLVRVEQVEDLWILTVTDKGIGMTLDVIQNCFLRAGVSFRDTREWKKEYVDSSGLELVRRSGKFGVGAFAAFLLGDKVEVQSRHINDEEGYTFSFSLDNIEIEVRRKSDQKYGTTIRIQLSTYAIEQLEIVDGNANDRLGWDWFTLDRPAVDREIVSRGKAIALRQEIRNPIQFEYSSGSWRKLSQKTYHDVFWSIDRSQPGLSCNGIKIGKSDLSERQDGKGGKGRIGTSGISLAQLQREFLSAPPVSAIDYAGAVPLSLQRHALEGDLPSDLAEELASDMALDFVAFCLACAPKNPFSLQASPAEYFEWYPYLTHSKWFLIGSTDANEIDKIDSDKFVWCHTADEVMPLMSASPLNFSSIVYQGSATQSLIRSYRPSLINIASAGALHCYVKDHADQLGFRFPNHVPCHFPLVTRLLRQLNNDGSVPFGLAKSAWCLLIGDVNGWKEMNTLQGTNLALWKEVQTSPYMSLYSFKEATPEGPIHGVIEQIRSSVPDQLKLGLPSILLVVDLEDRSGPTEPVTQIERNWIATIGHRGIPFSSHKREELIREVTSKNPRLASYYNSWKAFEPNYRAVMRRAV